MRMKPITAKIYSNTSLLGVIIEPIPEPEIAPGTRQARGLEGVTWVTDKFITQVNAILCDNGGESAGILLECPTRVATKIEGLIGTQTYVILSYHLARVINPDTGRIVNGVQGPIALE